MTALQPTLPASEPEVARGAESARWADRARAAVSLLRPLNVAMILLGVGVGGIMGVGANAWVGDAAARLLRAACSAALIGAGGNALNDVLDVDVDRVNRPSRPLPSGLVAPGFARVLGIMSMLGGLVLAVGLSTAHIAMALAAVGLLVLYNAWWSRVPIVGNVAIAVLIGLTLVYGGWAVGRSGPAWVGAIFAFLTTLAREIVKDAEDVSGDARAGGGTFALLSGRTSAARLACGILVLCVLVTPLPFMMLDYRGIFLLIMLLPDGLQLQVCWYLLDDQPERHLRRANHRIKAAMITGLAALAVGALVELGG